MTSPGDALLVGCGDLGSRIGLRLADRGHRVWGIRRDPSRVPPPLRGVAADLTRETPELPDDVDVDLLVVVLTARPRTAASYRATYVDGTARALDAVTAAGHRPRRSVFVSSTAVYGDLAPEPMTDETTVPDPGDGPARVLLEAEEEFRRRTDGTVVRFSGLYGASTRLLGRVLSGSVTDPDRWTNRIHRDDAAAAVVHLLTMPAGPDPLYVGTDDEPALLGDVAAHLAARLGAPEPPRADPARGHGKRLSNQRLRSTGWAPRLPTYREGYADLAVGPDPG